MKRIHGYKKSFLVALLTVCLLLTSTVACLSGVADATLPAGFVNDNDAAITYSAGWGYGDSRDWQTSAMGGGRAYSGTGDTTATLTFTGTKVSVIMTKQNGSGYVDISIDNGTATRVNTNSGGDTQWGVTVFESESLSAGQHTITVKNVDGGWGVGYVYLEGFVVESASAFPADEALTSAAAIEGSPFFINDDNASVIYTGSWGSGSQRLTNEAVSDDSMTYNYAGGGCAYAAAAGVKAQLYFTGSHLKVILGYSNGVFNIYVDGELVKENAAYTTGNLDVSNPDSVNEIAYSVDDLAADAVHSVVVEDVGSSWGRLVGFMVEGVVNNPNKLAVENDPGFINDNDASVVYSEGWGRDTGEETVVYAAGDGRAYTGTGAATATLTFTGNNVSVIMSKGGLADISIDGKPAVRVDTSTVSWTSTVFTKKGLANGEHTLVITNPMDNNWIYVEGFIVSDGPVLLDPDEVEQEAGFINDNDSHLVFEGNWGYGDREENGRIQDEAYAGGGFAYTGEAGTAKLTFEGTSVIVLMEKKPGNGFVDIYLDGVQQMSEDDASGAWNTNSTGDKDCNFPVFAIDGLTEGKHTIEVRNANPYGYGWIYLTGFLTDGEAVDYEPITPGNNGNEPGNQPGGTDNKPGDTDNKPGDTDNEPGDTDKPVSPATGVAFPVGAAIAAAVSAGLTVLLKKKQEA